MKKLTHCRACGSRALTPVFSMTTAPQGLFGPGRIGGKENGGYVLCDPSRDARACGLLQAAAANVEIHPSPSARHSSTRDHLRAVATEALEIISGRDCAALDIGCNDGTLLSFYPRWVDRYGIDSSALIEEIGDWAWSAQALFPSPEVDRALGQKKFDIITAISVLEQVDDARGFIKRARELLTEDGVLVIETLYAPSMLTRNGVEALQGGVSAVYSLAVLEWIVRECGLKIFKGALTGKAGGSIRLFITHAVNEDYDFDPWYERLARLWDEENALAMRAEQPYQSFEQRIAGVHRAIGDLFGEIAERGEHVHMLGADQITENMLRWIGGPARIVTAVVDTHAARDHERLGDHGPRIISEAECRAAQPDYLIAPARYKREVLERWRETILIGGRVIFLTPTPHIVTAANYAGEYGKAINAGDGPGGVETLRSILAAAGGLRLVTDNDATEKRA